ncbi:MAG TPA: pyridoxamine 5'-phosphate oxidase family protein [Polyangia bacterium]
MTATNLSESEKRDRLQELVSKFSTAMLVTRTRDGGMRARPLAIAGKRKDGGLYFSTAIESPKVDELEADAHVAVTMQEGRRFVSLSGVARVVRDRALVEELWAEDWKVWFPKGKDDPSLAIVVIEPHEAAYWDTSGTSGLRYVFEMAKAYATGTRPPSDDDERHTAHVKL